MFLFPTRFSAPVTRKPIPTVLEKKEERKKREEGKRKSFLIIRHVSARYSGSNDSDPIGTPRICIIGTVQTEMKDPVLEGGRRAKVHLLGSCRKCQRQNKLNYCVRVDPVAYLNTASRGGKGGGQITGQDGAGWREQKCTPFPLQAQLRGLLAEGRAAAAGRSRGRG